MATGAIKLLGDFVDPEQEQRFRAYSLNRDRQLSIVFSIIVFFAAIAFAANDFTETSVDSGSLTIRFIMAAVAMLSLLLSHLIGTQAVVYLSLSLLAITVAASNTFIALSRPPDYLLHLGIDALIIVCLYILLPTIRLQLMFAVLFTPTLIYLYSTHKDPVYEMAELTVPMTLILANLIGLGVSLLHNNARHRLFGQLEELQLAQESLSTLSQLIPMCASCKSIRNDAGYWEKVEIYMKETSGTQVTHGLCPACAEKMLKRN
ncbi:MAG: hypothetical protein JJ957_12100 [Pseudomonadales bacterium]|nr:hypothetical protein [Pseudomonadales bacterium]MBO6563103.1 hypothetical protein [Pseudomonadales bacterium]MBO6596949.1 hypothetical protein [Pseudomonadales bacterium]MBO6823062.1 hypothetical protein [Pseudomonadales bacterium]